MNDTAIVTQAIMDSTIRIDPSTWIERVLVPVEQAEPCGQSVRYDGTYDRIQEARREDDPALDQGVWARELKRANWEQVEVLCTEALEHRSKDLVLAIWLMEAWLHLYGFLGIRHGVNLLLKLSDGYWDSAFPKWDPVNSESRLAPFEWINEKLSLQVKHIPITAPKTSEAQTYSWADWEHALRLENEVKRNPDAIEVAERTGRVTRERFLASADLTANEFYTIIRDECGEIESLCHELDALLDARCGKSAPGLSQLKDIILAIGTFASNVERQRMRTEWQPNLRLDSEVVAEHEGNQPHIESRKNFTGRILSREEAYSQLLEAAEYLHQHEPHSPTPYMVKRAVRWGQMTLEEVFADMARSEVGVQGMCALLEMTPNVSRGAYDLGDED